MCGRRGIAALCRAGARPPQGGSTAGRRLPRAAVNAGLRRLASESAAYGLVPASSALTTLVLVPVTTRTFAPGDYGVLALLSAMTTLLSIVVVLSLDAAAQRFYLLSNDPSDQRSVI